MISFRYLSSFWAKRLVFPLSEWVLLGITGATACPSMASEWKPLDEVYIFAWAKGLYLPRLTASAVLYFSQSSQSKSRFLPEARHGGTKLSGAIRRWGGRRRATGGRGHFHDRARQLTSSTSGRAILWARTRGTHGLPNLTSAVQGLWPVRRASRRSHEHQTFAAG
jgi:hypothetical protein